MKMAELLAQAGERVHVIAQQWAGAPEKLVSLHDGRLLLHRISLHGSDSPSRQIAKQLSFSSCPTQVFSWRVSEYLEHLVEQEKIDLIEGPEWEGPLYYLQVRRAFGLGPVSKPPIVVHLHSPSKMIFENNEWDQTLTDFEPLCRFEEYSIRAADALLCPSHYLARATKALFHLEEVCIRVIPYPMGDLKQIKRDPAVWGRDSICYTGRLELRKGVVEWVKAGVLAAKQHSAVRFQFIGNDTSLTGGRGPSVLGHLKTLIPPETLSRFTFHGARSRPELLCLLAELGLAVVPSRWENLPFTCIEAMATGLPVIASPCGGMAELITDGESGWIARDGSPEGLKEALSRALATSPQERQAMGQNAAKAVRRLCGDDAVLDQHLEFRRQVLRRVRLAEKDRGIATQTSLRSEAQHTIGIVVLCHENNLDLLRACLTAIARQTVASKTVVVVSESLSAQARAIIDASFSIATCPLLLSCALETSADEAGRFGSDTLLGAFPGIIAISVISDAIQLKPEYVSAIESAFSAQPGVGLLSPWVLQRDVLQPGPHPVSISQSELAELPPGSAIRTEVLRAAADHRAVTLWAALAQGIWSAGTLPLNLVLVASTRHSNESAPRVSRFSCMALIQHGSVRFVIRWFLTASWPDKNRWLQQSFRDLKSVKDSLTFHSRRAAVRLKQFCYKSRGPLMGQWTALPPGKRRIEL